MGDDKPQTPVQPTPARPSICSDDVAVNDSMALLYSDEAPLPVTKKIQDARGKLTKDDYKAVWAWVPRKPDPSLLLFFHGNHHYVTVDKPGAPAKKYGKKKDKDGPAPPSRMPDWAENDDSAIAGVHAYPASGLYYQLDTLDTSQTGLPADTGTVKKPVVIVPEDVELLAPGGNDWAAPPLTQYSDADRLERLADNCYSHLRCLQNPSKAPYLVSTKDKSGLSYIANLKRLYLCGHSGGGKPMLECAAATWVLSGKVPVDVWLFDATYVWKSHDLDNYVALCQKWLDGGKLGNGLSDNRFVCIFKPKNKKMETEKVEGKEVPSIDPVTKEQKWHWTGTEMEADELRSRLAKLLKKKDSELWLEHTAKTKTAPDNLNTVIIPALKKNGVLFIRTYLEHESIPTTFIPVLLRTAAS
jgi:hypothetical protein